MPDIIINDIVAEFNRLNSMKRKLFSVPMMMKIWQSTIPYLQMSCNDFIKY